MKTWNQALVGLAVAHEEAAAAMRRDLPVGAAVRRAEAGDWLILDHTPAGLGLFVHASFTQGASTCRIAAEKVTHRRLPGQTWERIDGKGSGDDRDREPRTESYRREWREELMRWGGVEFERGRAEGYAAGQKAAAGERDAFARRLSGIFGACPEHGGTCLPHLVNMAKLAVWLGGEDEPDAPGDDVGYAAGWQAARQSFAGQLNRAFLDERDERNLPGLAVAERMVDEMEAPEEQPCSTGGSSTPDGGRWRTLRKDDEIEDGDRVNIHGAVLLLLSSRGTVNTWADLFSWEIGAGCSAEILRDTPRPGRRVEDPQDP